MIGRTFDVVRVCRPVAKGEAGEVGREQVCPKIGYPKNDPRLPELGVRVARPRLVGICEQSHARLLAAGRERLLDTRCHELGGPSEPLVAQLGDHLPSLLYSSRHVIRRVQSPSASLRPMPFPMSTGGAFVIYRRISPEQVHEAPSTQLAPSFATCRPTHPISIPSRSPLQAQVSPEECHSEPWWRAIAKTLPHFTPEVLLQGMM